MDSTQCQVGTLDPVLKHFLEQLQLQCNCVLTIEQLPRVKYQLHLNLPSSHKALIRRTCVLAWLHHVHIESNINHTESCTEVVRQLKYSCITVAASAQHGETSFRPVEVVVELVVTGHGDERSPRGSHAVEQLHRCIAPRLSAPTSTILSLTTRLPQAPATRHPHPTAHTHITHTHCSSG